MLKSPLRYLRGASERRGILTPGDMMPMARSTLLDGLQAHLRLNEAAGVRLDNSLRGNDVVPSVATVGRVAGKLGYAVELDGLTKYLGCAYTTDLSTGGDADFTIRVWIYLTDKTAYYVATSLGLGMANDWFIAYNNATDRFTFGLGGIGSVSANTLGSPAAGAWYRIVAQHDRTADLIKIKVGDGAWDTAPTGGAAPGNHTNYMFAIGSTDGNFILNGRVDDFVKAARLWSDAECTEDWNGGAGTSIGCCSDLPLNAPLAPPIAASNQVAINALRAAMVNEIWSGFGLPVAGIDGIAHNVADPLSSSSANLDHVDQLTINMDDNLGGFIMACTPYVWWPITSNNRLALLNHGHDAQWDVWGQGDLTRALTGAGYAVIGFQMPANGQVAIHNTYTDLPGLNYLKFFIEPIVRVINQYGAGYTRVCMVGLSGGGWTTTFCAAVDTRIDRSAPVSGSLPLYIVDAIGRDWEQMLPGLAGFLDYQDLYIMACDGGRRQVQLLSVYDPVRFDLFNYWTGTHYADPCGVVAAAVGGNFLLLWDNDNQHTISAFDQAQTLACFNA